nr:MAG: hypothetical protein DIU64_12635 [Caldicoprobacter oshimai]
MVTNGSPTMDEWRELYQAAIEFKNAQPWQWLYDMDLICVQNPADQTIGYCSIMGKNAEFYALGVYLGPQGLWGFAEMAENADIIPRSQIMHYQNCIMCSFENREELTDVDRKIIKELGLKFRGKNAWPKFRRFEPGYYPWYITRYECLFLTHALRQTLFVALNVRDGKLKLDIENERTILRYAEQENGKLNWYSKEIELGYPIAIYRKIEINDDVLIRKLNNVKRNKNMVIEVDTLYMPAPVRESKDARPYYPRIYVAIEAKTSFVMGYDIYKSKEEDVDISLNNLVNMFLDNGLPGEIHVRGDRMASIVQDLCKKTGIRLKITGVLPAVDSFIEEMEEKLLV